MKKWVSGCERREKKEIMKDGEGERRKGRGHDGAM